ncbi:MAG TPA: HEAT repeat domain-containing protein [Candidatus Eisenbacteria bacterium]
MITRPTRHLAHWALAAMLAIGLPTAARLVQPAPAWAMPDKEDAEDVDDPAEPAYDAAHDLLDEEEYEDAVAAFDKLVAKYPKSPLAGESLYWKAFALFRLEDSEHLQNARKVLLEQGKVYPKAATRRDAKDLLIRIDGQLARMGDSEAAARLAAEGKRMSQDDAVREARAIARAEADAARGKMHDVRGTHAYDDDDDDMDTQMAALQALMQMNPERSIPILRKILARRDARSAELRSHALFLLGQIQTPESEAMLLDAVRNDPDIEVKKNGVFWLSQNPSEASLDAILEILRTSPTDEVQESSVFALSQHPSPRAREALRDLALNPKATHHVREQAIFWIGQDSSDSSIEFLKAIYRKTTEDDLKEKILFSISQQGSEASESWLLERARDPNETMDVRKNAIFWLGQTGALDSVELKEIYRTCDDSEMKQQIIFVASQQGTRASVDLLIEIARNDTDKEMRQQAIFWLGQSGDEKATDYLESLLGGE